MARKIRSKSLISSIRTGVRPPRWNPLDNAAKIFPPTSHGADTGVFRISSELIEDVQPELLQQALGQVLERFAHMRMVMRHGLFWYYLEQTNAVPLVVPEHAPPCAPLYTDSRSLLFEVSYWRHKINLDIFHVLTDGTGAFAFFRALLTRYLLLCHPEIEFEEESAAATSDRYEDSFQRYCEKTGGLYIPSHKKAYHLKGPRRPEGGLSILEGVTGVQDILDAAHRHGVTLTVYLCAVLFCAIHEEMYVRDASMPVVLTVPVNLRDYFSSDTVRNFFGTIRIPYDFKAQGADFENVVRCVSESFRQELTSERISARMNQLAALEHNPLIRPIPLALKNSVLRLAGTVADRGETAVLSNVGRFELPAPFAPYLKGLSVFMSTHALQLCVCSCAGRIHLGFTSAFANSGVQRRFFSRLVADGAPIEIRSNEFNKEDSPCNTAPSVK